MWQIRVTSSMPTVLQMHAAIVALRLKEDIYRLHMFWQLYDENRQLPKRDVFVRMSVSHTWSCLEHAS